MNIGSQFPLADLKVHIHTHNTRRMHTTHDACTHTQWEIVMVCIRNVNHFNEIFIYLKVLFNVIRLVVGCALVEE